MWFDTFDFCLDHNNFICVINCPPGCSGTIDIVLIQFSLILPITSDENRRSDKLVGQIDPPNLSLRLFSSDVIGTMNERNTI